jgi:hypothetical protein
LEYLGVCYGGVKRASLLLFLDTFGMIGVDNGNVGFLLLMLILFPLIYRVGGFESSMMNFSLMFIVKYGLLMLLLLLLNILLFFV